MHLDTAPMQSGSRKTLGGKKVRKALALVSAPVAAAAAANSRCGGDGFWEGVVHITGEDSMARAGSAWVH